MIAAGSGVIPPPLPGCRVSVVIPARNEAAYIGRALAALVAQRDVFGNPIEAGTFDVIVFANNCSDATAAIVRAIATSARHVPIHVVEAGLSAPDAHVGAARKYVMDLAAARFISAGMPHGIVASTDSDTVVDAAWIAWTLRESVGVEAVAGQVCISEADQARLLAPVRLLYARELTYRRLVAEAEALIDPVPEDPLPRHSSFVGASFAVTSRAYIAAGALPSLPLLEDLNFCRALRRIDARIRHSPFVRATTSSRTCARVDGGFGTFLANLHERAEHAQSFPVEHPDTTLAAFELRARLRRLWLAETRAVEGAPNNTNCIEPGSGGAWLGRDAHAPTFGQLYERVAARQLAPDLPDVPVEFAIDALRAAVQHRMHTPVYTADGVASSMA